MSTDFRPRFNAVETFDVANGLTNVGNTAPPMRGAPRGRGAGRGRGGHHQRGDLSREKEDGKKSALAETVAMMSKMKMEDKERKEPVKFDKRRGAPEDSALYQGKKSHFEIYLIQQFPSNILLRSNYYLAYQLKNPVFQTELSTKQSENFKLDLDDLGFRIEMALLAFMTREQEAGDLHEVERNFPEVVFPSPMDLHPLLYHPT
jgi:hypothetical protein